MQSATSGEQAAQDIRDEEVPEESGGPFVETSGRSEFAYGTDASNPKDAERAPFPTTRREKYGWGNAAPCQERARARW